MPAVRGEEHVPVGSLYIGAAAEDQQVGGVDVGAVFLLRQAESADSTVGEQLRHPGPDGRILALPDRTQAQDGDLPGVPVDESLEAQHLRQCRDPTGVPTFVLVPVGVGRRGKEGREQRFLGPEFEEV